VTLSALTASIAHEVSQPLSGIVTNASTCLHMLAADPPNVDGARTTAQRTLRDASRASEVIQHLRGLFARKQPITEPLDLNDAVREVLASHQANSSGIESRCAPISTTTCRPSAATASNCSRSSSISSSTPPTR
jgi:C4-dicarboxylate-specific signal transduction histidine kinase